MAVSKILKNETFKMTIAQQVSVSYTFDGYAGLLYLSRKKNYNAYVLLGFDYWTDGYVVLAGSLPSDIVVTHATHSLIVTITNNSSYTVGCCGL